MSLSDKVIATAKAQRLATLYCHDCDANSLKLLLFVLETGLLPALIDVVHVTKQNQVAIQTELLQKYTNCHINESMQGRDSQAESGIFPVCVCSSDDSILRGADRIISMLMDEVPHLKSINWQSQMTVFNFFTCGMKLEMDLMKVRWRQQYNTFLC